MSLVLKIVPDIYSAALSICWKDSGGDILMMMIKLRPEGVVHAQLHRGKYD